MMRRRVPRAATLLAATFASASCSLEEITLVDAEEVVVAEVHVQLSPGDPGASRATAWLHRTLEGGSPSSRPVPGADVLITSSRGFSLELAETAVETCVHDTPVQGTGTCYATTAALAARFVPGEHLAVEITLRDGGVLRGQSVVPGDFNLRTPSVPACDLAPRTPLEVRWTRSEGAWAYVSETLIHGLRDALEPQGIQVERDPFFLLGLSVSAADTTIVFPGEFGIFDRFDLDQALSVALQQGLPEGTVSDVMVTATDRNYVNWIRGGNFNPSGVVKIPSLRGDGTGVFATTVSRRFQAVVGLAGGLPPCDTP